MPTLTYLISVLYAASCLPTSIAHMYMKQPAPMWVNEEQDPNEIGNKKTPLETDGANFPCKVPKGTDVLSAVGPRVPLAAGIPHTLIFNDHTPQTATHGGGSCQISVSYADTDAKLREPSNWHVIKSIVGGCPSNAPGSLSNTHQCSGDEVECLNQFNFEIPPELKNGNAIFAWTWFNNVGNREMYMNCAHVEITGAVDGTADMSQFPTLFTANIGGQCKTSEGGSVMFPNPGQTLEYRLPGDPNAKVFPIKDPVGCAGGSGGSVPAGTTVKGSSGDASVAEPTGPIVSGGSGGGGGGSQATSGANTQDGGAVTRVTQTATSDADFQAATGGAQRPPPTGAPSYNSPATGNSLTFATRKKGVTYITRTRTRDASAPSSRPSIGTTRSIPIRIAGGEAPTGYGGSDEPSPTDAPGYEPGSPSGDGTSTGSSAGSTASSCQGGSVSCSTPGQLVCISAQQFGLCDNNNCAVPQAVAAGTQCKDGAIGFVDGYGSNAGSGGGATDVTTAAAATGSSTGAYKRHLRPLRR